MLKKADVALALAVFAVSLGLLAGGGVGGRFEHGRDLDALGVVLVALASLPLMAWRRAPLHVFVVTAAASAALNALEYPPGPPLGPTVALFGVAARRERVHAPVWVTGGVVGALFIVHLAGRGIALGEFPGTEILLGLLLWGGALVAGDRSRQRSARIERERRLAVAEERMRIARDLHDSAGHAINVILVQAGAARLLQEQDPAQSRAALETIEEVARETLTEIDRLVRVLREEDAVPAEQDGPVELPTGVAALEALAERHRAGGLEVGMSVEGPSRQLPRAVDQAAYRIVQESLTNALRHGRGAADVALTFGDDALEIAVTNPVAPDARAKDGGHGIVGMRERAVLVGGSLEAGRDDGVFRVRARLPYSGDGAA